MDNMVYKPIENIISSIGSSGWTGMNAPGSLEQNSGLWVSKAGARYFPKGFFYSPGGNIHWEWGAILEGGFEFESDGGLIKAYKGSSYIMPPDIHLTARPLGNPFLVWIEFKGPLAAEAVSRFGGSSREVTIHRYELEQVKSLLRIANLLHNHPYGYELLVHSSFWKFLANSINPGSSAAKEVSPEIKAVLDYLESLGEFSQCSLRELAKVSGLSLETFRKRFFNETGEAPIKYMLKLQIKRAKELLAYKQLSVRQVAEEIGLSDPYYFSRLFKKYEGLSPVQFRKHFYPELFVEY